MSAATSRVGWYVVLILSLASTLSFIDRQILNVMIGPIIRDLGGLTDTEISLIIGLAFSLIYSISTLPLARIADAFEAQRLPLVYGIVGAAPFIGTGLAPDA